MTSREHILFVCTANIDRSKTAEDLYRDDPRYEVRSAGVATFADRRVDRDLLRWANRIFVMDDEYPDRHRSTLRLDFPDFKGTIEVLDVKDQWKRGHPQLQKLLLKRLHRHLGSPQTPPDRAQ